MNEEITTTKGVLRICCADSQNLVAERQSGDLVVRTCRECGRNHYELSVDPGHFGIELKH